MLFFLFADERASACSSGSATPYRARTRGAHDRLLRRRTSHGSTLSFITHAAVLAGVDPESSWERFLVALESDIGDIQGGTTKEGIHMGVMCGTLDLIQRGYLGSRDPRRRPLLQAAAHRPARRPVVLRCSSAARRSGRRSPAGELTRRGAGRGPRRPIRVGVGDDVRELGPGDECTFALGRTAGRGTQ